MKKIVFIMIACLCALQMMAQKPGVLKNQVDAWGVTYTYTGELLNGKANGMGVAKYPSGGNALRYVGHFENGAFSGKGVLFFENGLFLSGVWSKGKLNGKGANFNSDGSLYIGDFVNGNREGQGIMFLKDKSIVKGNYVNNNLAGRCINIWANGAIINEGYYANGLRNGVGYQYEATSKQLFQGEWKDDKWVQAATPGFKSFLISEDFTGESTDDHVLIGAVTKDGYIKDTGYFYNKAKNKRYFGYYSDGFIKNGIQAGDSTKFIGAVDDNGAQGYCYDFKLGKYYSEGYFKDDKLDGEIMDIDLAKKSVYFGTAVAGTFTGKAYFFNDYATMYAGNYVSGKFTGQGYRLESTGHCTVGTWKDGEATTVTSITTAKGEVIPGAPKTFAEALNIVVKDWEGDFDNIIGNLDYDDDSYLDDLEDTSYTETYHTLITFPGSVKADQIKDNYDDISYYKTTLLETTDATKAKTKFGEVARQLVAAVITNKTLTTPTHLKENTALRNNGETETIAVFQLTATNDAYNDFKVLLRMVKGDDGNYTVSMEIGNQTSDDGY